MLKKLGFNKLAKIKFKTIKQVKDELYDDATDATAKVYKADMLRSKPLLRTQKQLESFVSFPDTSSIDRGSILGQLKLKTTRADLISARKALGMSPKPSLKEIVIGKGKEKVINLLRPKTSVPVETKTLIKKQKVKSTTRRMPTISRLELRSKK